MLKKMVNYKELLRKIKLTEKPKLIIRKRVEISATHQDRGPKARKEGSLRRWTAKQRQEIIKEKEVLRITKDRKL